MGNNYSTSQVTDKQLWDAISDALMNIKDFPLDYYLQFSFDPPTINLNHHAESREGGKWEENLFPIPFQNTNVALRVMAALNLLSSLSPDIQTKLLNITGQHANSSYEYARDMGNSAINPVVLHTITITHYKSYAEYNQGGWYPTLVLWDGEKVLEDKGNIASALRVAIQSKLGFDIRKAAWDQIKTALTEHDMLLQEGFLEDFKIVGTKYFEHIRTYRILKMPSGTPAKAAIKSAAAETTKKFIPFDPHPAKKTAVSAVPNKRPARTPRAPAQTGWLAESDFVTAKKAHTVTAAEYKIKQRVRHNLYGDGSVVNITDLDMFVEFDRDQGKDTKAKRFDLASAPRYVKVVDD